jgi:hypothetical protein
MVIYDAAEKIDQILKISERFLNRIYCGFQKTALKQHWGFFAVIFNAANKIAQIL